MPLQATSGTASYDAFGGGAAAGPTYIEDVFSTWLYTGTGATQTITNGIDLAGKGGLVWAKIRSGFDSPLSHALFDTSRGVLNRLASNLTDAQASTANSLTAFNSTGFTVGSSVTVNGGGAGDSYVSWTFRKQPKFFDVVTYTGNGANRTIAHSLGSVPGCIIVKRTDTISDWQVYHNSLTSAAYSIQLDLTNTQASAPTVWNSTAPTSTVFSVGTSTDVNASGGTYVAYLFAHNAGGFGLTATDNVISCGSFTTDASSNATVNLGYEPQWLLIKPLVAGNNWLLYDNMRGVATGGNSALLRPNLPDEEVTQTGKSFTATGFNYTGGASTTFIYIAIRRGPMKVPTSGTSVFLPYTAAVATGGVNVSTGFVADTTFSRENRAAAGSSTYVSDRLRGSTASYQGTLITRLTAAESTAASGGYYDYAYNTSVYDKFAANNSFAAGNFVDWIFKRAPNFFDVVCYTGTGVARTITHNLQAVPELMIVKSRSLGTESWTVWNTTIASSNAANFLWLNSTSNIVTNSNRFNSTAPTSSVFTVGSDTSTNGSGSTYVAYLFATCAGVSKVGSYTGNGSSQTINCGFTGGARFVLIKRTDSTGDWYVWDTARGIVAGNDPYLSLNTSVAEVTTDDTIDTDSTGFIVNQVTATNVNVTSATYIFLAIA